MMISPESYAVGLQEKTYNELLAVRDELIDEIREYEKPSVLYDPQISVGPSPEVVYQMNLMYLAEVCKLIAQKYSEICE